MYVACTDIGKSREMNEDYYLVKKIYDDSYIYIVADGIGGYKSGEIASKMCAEIISEILINEYARIMGATNKDKTISSILTNALKKANEEIYKLSKQNEKFSGMGTTLVLVFKYKKSIYYMSVGDSRIYYIKKDCSSFEYLTEDDTFVNELLRKNAITAEEAKNHSQKHVLTKAVGVFESVDTEVQKITSDENGYLLLCTDGLTNMVSEKKMLDILKNKPFNETANELINEANKNGGTDNITVVLLDI